MKWCPAASCWSIVIRAWVTIAMMVLLNTCKFADCEQLLKREISKDGRFVAEALEAGNCVSSLNTTITDVTLTDADAWIGARSTPFTAKGVSDVQLFWRAPNQLTIRYSFPGRVPERILRRENRWRGVSITYEEIPGMASDTH